MFVGQRRGLWCCICQDYASQSTSKACYHNRPIVHLFGTNQIYHAAESQAVHSKCPKKKSKTMGC